jgi:hypothetical protein
MNSAWSLRALLAHGKKLLFHAPLAAAVLILASSSATSARAATINNWNVAGGGSWNVAANWNPANIPLPTEDATFGVATTLPASTTAITLDANQTVYGVTSSPGSSKTLTIGSGTPTTSILTLLSSDSTNSGGTFYALSATNGATQINSPIQLGDNTTTSSTATFNSSVNASNFVINGALTEAAGQTWGVQIVGSGTGIVNYGTTGKTYHGDTTIATNGILKINTNDMLPDGVGFGNVVLQGNGQLQFNNTNETINALNSTSATAAVSKSGSNTRTLQIGNGDASGNYAGTISMTGGSSTITKIGLGTQTFGGNVSLAGGFSTNAGTSLINSTFSAASATVAAAATLGGTGTATLTGTLTQNGSIAPGAGGPGVLSISTTAANFSATGGLSIEIGGNTPGNTSSSYDQLLLTNAAGTMALNAASTLGLSVVNGFTPSLSDVYYILSRTDTGTFSTLFAGTTEGGAVSLGGGYSGQITYLANWTGTQGGSSLTGGNDIAIYNVQAVPEPAAWLLLAACGAAMIAFRRRQVNCC